MNLAADISLYPLQDNFIPPIQGIIERFEAYEAIEVRRNALSTQLFGEYERVMEVIHAEMKRVFDDHQAVLVVKFACLDAATADERCVTP